MILFEKFSPLETPLNSIWFLVEHCAFNISIKLLFYFFLKNLQTQLLNSGTYFFLQQTKINISKIKVSAKILCIETCTHYYIINPIQDGLFSGLLTDGRGAKRTPSLKSVTHPTMMKLGKFWYIKKYRYRLHFDT